MNGVRKVIDKIRGDREFFGWIGAIVIGTISALGWMSSNFMTVAKAEQMMDKVKVADAELARDIKVADSQLADGIKQLAAEVGESNTLLTIHMSKHELDSVMGKISENKNQQFNIQQFTRVNGMDSQSELRLQELANELEALEIQRTCILTNNPLCD
jgi:hypothetical protein